MDWFWSNSVRIFKDYLKFSDIKSKLWLYNTSVALQVYIIYLEHIQRFLKLFDAKLEYWSSYGIMSWGLWSLLTSNSAACVQSLNQISVEIRQFFNTKSLWGFRMILSFRVSECLIEILEYSQRLLGINVNVITFLEDSQYLSSKKVAGRLLRILLSWWWLQNECWCAPHHLQKRNSLE